MKLQSYLNIVLVISFGLVGCSDRQVGQSVRQAVHENKTATSLLEWQQSEVNPELLFSEWRAEASLDEAHAQELQKRLCTELLALEPEALSVFENEIQNKENASLLASCRDSLVAELDEYYAAQRHEVYGTTEPVKTLAAVNQFQFPVNIQKRDTTNGYFAVTGDVARKEVILTFDDGPSGLYTEPILQALRAVNAKALFFYLGKSVRANPELVRKVAADGHSVGSHSTSHACLGTKPACAKTNGRILSFDAAAAEIRGGHQAVFDVLGWVDPFFRFPYGETSPELKNFLKTNSVGEFYWSIDSEDWKAQSNERLLRNTLAALDVKGRGIVLFHDIQRKTAEVMPQFLKELYVRGYSVVLLQPADLNVRYQSKLVKKPLP